MRTIDQLRCFSFSVISMWVGVASVDIVMIDALILTTVPRITARREFLTKAMVGLLPAVAHARNLPESTGADLSRSGSLEALVPIVTLRNQISALQMDLSRQTALENALHRLSSARPQLPRDESSFKRIFDAYSDGVSYKQRFVDQNAFLVYYSKGFDGPGRPALESDMPVKQTLQFGARNEAWIVWQEFLDEAAYAANHPLDGSVDDLVALLSKAVAAVDGYLALAPEEDVSTAIKAISR